MNSEGRKRRKVILITIVLSIVAVWLILMGYFIFRLLGNKPFDEGYWKDTNQFYMVFDMEADFDSASSYTHIDMIRISNNRTRMAKDLMEKETLIGLNKEELENKLGSYMERIGGSIYKDTVQYIIEASRRGFQFYGESGNIYKYFVISFDENEKISDVRIVDKDEI